MLLLCLQHCDGETASAKMYRSVMSRSKQNLLSSTSVVLRTQDFSVTDSVSPWKKKDKITISYYIYITVLQSWKTGMMTSELDAFCSNSQASLQIGGQRSPCAGSSAL